MGILNRISTLIKSNLNAAVDKMTDPGKQIDQLVIEMEEQQRKARGEVQTTLALEKRHKQKAEALAKTVDEWQARAERAVTAGDDGLAKEALKRRAEVQHELDETLRLLAEQKDYGDQLTAALKALDVRVKEVKMRKETLKAQARAQKSRSDGTGPTEAFNRFDKLASDVDAKEAEVALDDELAKASHTDSKSLEMERRFDEMSKDKDVDDRLAALKAKLKKPEDEK
jgi:phage shock protein A